MIHDATVEVTCDREEQCDEHVFIQPEYVYGSRSSSSGHYDTRDKAIERLLGGEGWVVDGIHYCSPEHTTSAEGKESE